MDQFEPRLSKTAAKSDKWYPVNPGTEGALALGMSNVILNEGLYDQDFVDNYSAGLAECKKIVLDRYSPETVTKMTGVDAVDITAMARAFARARRPLAICGRGAGKSPGSLQDFMAVHILNALVGSINRAGGIVAVPEPDYIDWPDIEMDAVASRGMQQPRIDGAGSGKYKSTRYLLNRLPEMVTAGQDSPVQVLFVAGTNPRYSMVNTAAVTKAFDKIPLVVSFSSFMDETAAGADYILPNHIFLERFEDVPCARGFPRPIIGLTQPVVEPLFNTMHTGDVVIQLAQLLGGTVAGALAWESYGACLEETMGDKWDTLVEEGFWVDPEFSISAQNQKFETDSAKFEFSNSDINALPIYHTARIPGDESFYPLLLVPYDSMRLASGYIGSPPFMVKSLEDTVLVGNEVLVEVNPATAKKLGLSDRQPATLTTAQGSARVRVFYFDGIMPGVISFPRGLGHTAYDRFLAGKGINYNALNKQMEDEATGLDAAWGVRARLTKA